MKQFTFSIILREILTGFYSTWYPKYLCKIEARLKILQISISEYAQKWLIAEQNPDFGIMIINLNSQ